MIKKIQLIIRDSGIASRRKAEELILEGRVTLNGQVVEDPTARADLDRDHIKVDGKLLRLSEDQKHYYLFNKPRNVVSTMDDPEGRPCLGDLIKALKKRLFPVGRLDFDAEGLMILTNDGALAQKLSHPSNQIPRTYLVKVRGTPEDKVLSMIRKGMPIGEGDRLGDVQFWVTKRQTTTTWIKITLYEGKKNELKRVFFRIDHPIRKIRRIAFGPFFLGTLPVGHFRPLTDQETAKLKGLTEPAEGKSAPGESADKRRR
jgi:23S rRNA pseudouridine2605 synthase